MKNKTVFYCTECGNETPKWAGKCPACGAWNTIVEEKETVSSKGKSSGTHNVFHSKATRLNELTYQEEIRFSTGIGELDRVLGGGAVKGSLVLVSGAPGIGKSTLLLQICEQITSVGKVLYVSGEESQQQILMRSKRLKMAADDLLILTETLMDNVLDVIETEKPEILIVDSIQTMYESDSDSTPGSVSQVKACTLTLMQLAKSTGMTVFVIGHVNKEGAIAGPKVLEHMVDCVLYFEGDQHNSYRILRAAKNRFGATNEIGVFEMHDVGLIEVPNPSEMLLAEHSCEAAGTCVTCVMEGERPILAEIQALLSNANGANPRRTTNGFDYTRCSMLMAVLEKHGNLKVSACDAYTNIVGGLVVDEPAADLAMTLALASSYLDQPITGELAAVGEIGLTGELRHINHLDLRLQEIKRLGLKKCIIPNQKYDKNKYNDLEIYPAKNISEALKLFLKVGKP